MGNNTSLSSSQSLTAVNNVLQASQAKCNVSCNQNSSGNVVVIGKGSKVGNIDFSQTCVISNASCIIKQTIEANVTNILKSLANQSTFASQPLYAASVSATEQSAVIEQNVYNSVTQLISSTCGFETNQTLTNNYVYVGDGSSTGNVSFAQNSTISNVECAQDIAAKAIIFNQLTSETSQKAVTIDTLTMIAICIVGVLGMGFFLILVFLFKGGGGSKAPPAPKAAAVKAVKPALPPKPTKV